MGEVTILIAILCVPVAVAALLACLRGDTALKAVSTLGAGVLAVLGFKLFCLPAAQLGELRPALVLPWFPSFGVTFALGADGVSRVMILLTTIVAFAGVLVSWSISTRVKEYFVLFFILCAGVLGVFMSQDLFVLFLFFEVAVLPMYLLIGIWGSGPKEYAAMKLTLMLMGGSAFLFVGILGLGFEASRVTGAPLHFSMPLLAAVEFPLGAQRWLFPLLFVGFGVIGALFPLHSWSPDGHSSAPTAVSMLHAGVLMKLGGYGCLRTIQLLPEGAHEWAGTFLVITTLNVIYGGWVACRRTDLKYITAFSSVSHCGLVLWALVTMNETGYQGAVLQMFSHGVMTALAFACIGMMYDRTHVRDITKLGGLAVPIPIVACGYFVAALAALGLPGLAGFAAEFTVFVGGWNSAVPAARLLTVLCATSIVVTALYMLNAATATFFGPLKRSEWSELPPVTWQEKAGVAVLVAVLFYVGLFPSSILSMSAPVMELLARSAG